MDQRHVFSTNQELLAMLEDLHIQKQSASLIVDSEGLSRLEGHITSIDRKEDCGKTAIIIEEGFQFELRQVVAVNGVFRSDYSEC